MRIFIALTMFAFWLVLSGHYETWLIVVGAVCSLAVAMFAGHMGIADREGHPLTTVPRALIYWPWLMKEIAVSALQVARIIVDPRLPITPTLVRVKASQRTAVGLATYANSITLTPGTISAEVSSRKREILVHALTREGAASFAGGEMDRRVWSFEFGAGLMFEVAILAVLVALALAVTRALKGPSVFDRLLAANATGTGAILLLSLFGFLTGRPEFLDIGITYVLLNLIGTLAVLKFFRYGALGHLGDEDERTRVL